MPSFPTEVDYLWRAFHRLSARRGSTGFGPAAISWFDLDAFQRFTGASFAPWEVETLERLDQAYMAELGRQRAG
ncbi:hypothetical protein [Mesorhizobium sp. B2-4-6]|uniref:phage tail assembly chaperone n=1 Tax=Mesorhizobium sp. B2-4-6 TaxID=2589943 RepID=UPI00112D59FC|nr:hypothetical protein [Mesorhizobium sp. B2-4-6]TPL40699.1 hypothetical protein FJ957_26065 [Mesorhizobium sp. B2-4-6]